MRVLGVDLGIASCGWAVVEPEGDPPRIISAGVRCFDAPLVDKTGEPKSAVRRGARGQRRVIRRRRQRMQKVRAILHRHGLLGDVANEALRDAMRRVQLQPDGKSATPWRLRALAHDRLLSDDEFSVALGHIARHRGFRSNSKRDTDANAADETSKMKKAMEETREGLAKYRSFGEMIESDQSSRTASATATRSIRTRRSARTSKTRYELDLRRSTPLRQSSGQPLSLKRKLRTPRSPSARCKTVRTRSGRARSSRARRAPPSMRLHSRCSAFSPG